MEMEQISARAESFASVLTPGGEVRSHRWLLPVKAALDTLAALRRAGGDLSQNGPGNPPALS